MPSRTLNPCKPPAWVRLALVAVLTLIVSDWTTCAAIFAFSSCPGAVSPPQVNSLLPDSVAGDTTSLLLTVRGAGFVPQSQILWNGNALPTTFVDSQHLQTTITQQTFDSFGGTAGGSVRISATSPASTTILGCPTGATSATLVLIIT